MQVNLISLDLEKFNLDKLENCYNFYNSAPITVNVNPKPSALDNSALSQIH